MQTDRDAEYQEWLDWATANIEELCQLLALDDAVLSNQTQE